MRAQAYWHGTQAEAEELAVVADRNCLCQFNTSGYREASCQLHEMLAWDQHFLDRLLFARRIADRLRQEEWSEDFLADRADHRPACAHA